MAKSDMPRIIANSHQQAKENVGPPSADRFRRKICLAASGGGHVRQLLDLQPVWGEHDAFFVTEDTPLGKSLAADHRTYFLPHFAWGQAKLGAPLRMLRRAAQSLVTSARVILKERPDTVISTGAGAVFFTLVFGRLMGARIIAIESFARFETPSLFGRFASRISHSFVIQSARLRKHYPRAEIFDPLQIISGAPPRKKDLLFATVGATLPFDRLVSLVASAKADGSIPEQVVVQTGVGGFQPPGISVSEKLSFSEVQSILKDATIVVCHGGTGSIITALREGCHVIAIPRLAELGEHYDDHQSEIVSAFEKRGLVVRANNLDELRAALAIARGRPPTFATTQPTELIEFLRGALEDPKKR